MLNLIAGLVLKAALAHGTVCTVDSVEAGHAVVVCGAKGEHVYHVPAARNMTEGAVIQFDVITL